MLIKRSQGRPCRGTNEVGRARIIERLQQALRAEPIDDLSRKSIAEHIGITPALITYYFPSKQSIIEEATRPVVEAYMRDIKTIAQSDAENSDKLHSIIELLLRCYRSDTGIIRAYESAFRADKSKKSFIDAISRELAALVDKLIGPDLDCDFKKAAVQGAITGMCEIVAQSEQDSLRWPGARSDTNDADKVRFIYTFIVNGLPKSHRGMFVPGGNRHCGSLEAQGSA